MMNKTLFIALFAMCATAGAMAQGKISVTVEGLKNTKGLVYVTLQNSAEMFESKTDKFYKVAVINIENGERNCMFENIPAGIYAATILHDEDSNKKLTTNFIGMPTEGFGFSNNAKGKMSKPSFKVASFTVESGKTAEQKIKFIYL